MTRQRVALAAFLAVVIALPWAVSGRLSLSLFLFMGLNALIAVGLSLLGGQAGQISLGQAAFYGVGAYISAITTLRYGVDPWLGMALAVGGAALLAYLVGAPILILRGHFLVLGTLALNIIVDVVIRNLQSLTGGPSGLTGIPPLTLAGLALRGDRVFYYLAWSAALGAVWLGRNLIASRVGRALAAVRASEVAAATLGINPAHYKARTFAVSAAFAGLAGSLYVHYLSFVSPAPFNFEFSITLLVMSVLGGIASLPGAVVGAAILTTLRETLRTVLPRFFRAGASAEYEIIIFGLLLAAVVIFAPGGVWPYLIRLLRLGRPVPPALPDGPGVAASDVTPTNALDPVPAPAQRLPADPSRPPTPDREARGEELPLLSVDHLSKRFGGLVAVNDLSFRVRAGEIYTIIGPNGAGKTTVFNLISGILRPTHGTITLGGRSIDHRPAYDIAAAGIARTFQTPYVFADLTVIENVMLGMHGRLRTGFIAAMLRLTRREEREAQQESLRYLDDAGLTGLSRSMAGALPFGAQRLVEIARALATRPRLLLLDEPASGLSAVERARLVALIRRIRAGGVTVILVEHDVGLVMGLADRVLVLNYGQRIAEDTPAAVRRDPGVIGAYLGEPA